MRVDLGTHSKSSADHVLAFRPCIRIQLAIVAAFTVGAAIIISLPRMVEHSEKQAKIQQENVYVVRR